MDRLLHSESSHIIGDDYQTTTLDDSDGWVVAITNATYEPTYRLRLTFSDGHEQVIDFEPFLRQSLHPDIRQYLDPALFEQFTLADGDLFWHDYTLCFPISDLYRGEI